MLIIEVLGHFFVVTAVAEIVGCYLPYLWLKRNGPAWLLIPAMASLALFAWLLTLHPAAAGRVYAAYGGVYVGVAIFWLWLVDGQRPTSWDLVGAAGAVAALQSSCSVQAALDNVARATRAPGSLPAHFELDVADARDPTKKGGSAAL